MVKILVPIDYSPCSIAALKQAAALVRGTDGLLIVLHVVESGSDRAMLSAIPDQYPLWQDMALLLKSFTELTPPIRFEEMQLEGVPVSSILSLAEEVEADLIVMGTTGRTGIKRFLLGSVAEEICRRASCPVLLLKSQSRESHGAQEEIQVSSWEKWASLDRSSMIEVPSPDELPPPEINDNPTFSLITRAIAARASDIHIDPLGTECVVRFRVDGQLTEYCRLSNEVGHSLITQIKVIANFDIADPFHSKEGRLPLPNSFKDFEVRVTSVPVMKGEAVSLRVLSRNRLMRPLEQLGLSKDARSAIEQILRHREGIVLVTGPTGSGKTTTLYSLLCAADDGKRNIVSIEDPVEYHVPTFRQLSVDHKHGMTMSQGLRTLLRLDPDVVFVGEIRDAEAAETAMRAASSGKYVFSSLHTRDVASTVTALRDLHIDNRSLAGNLVGIISQRLLRRLCEKCSRPEVTTEREAAIFLANELLPPAEIRHPVGCPHCRGTGYFDRIGIFEVLTSDIGIMNAIEDGESENQLRRLMDSHGVCTLKRDALQKVAEGIISLEECARMTEIHFEPQSIVAIAVDASSKIEAATGLLTHSM